MDPDANYLEQIETALRILRAGEGEVSEGDAVRLAELVIALNDWTANGGFLPRKLSGR